MKGAEADVEETIILGIKAIKKTRNQKKYRLEEIDSKLRKERTRSEAKLLNKLKMAGVYCPTVLQVTGFCIYMTKINGKRPKMTGKQCNQVGSILAKMHNADIIHGDFTPANLLRSKNGIAIIDLGLGYISKEIEDKAIDVYTMLKSIAKKEEFISGYSKYEKFEQVMRRLKKVESRIRYAF